VISSRSSLGKLRSDILIFRGVCGVCMRAFGYVLGTIGGFFSLSVFLLFASLFASFQLPFFPLIGERFSW